MRKIVEALGQILGMLSVLSGMAVVVLGSIGGFFSFIGSLHSPPYPTQPTWLDNWGVPLGLLSGFALVLLGAYLLDGERDVLAMKRGSLQLILDSTDRSFEEYLTLFPGACKNCGCRRFVFFSGLWEMEDYQEGGASSYIGRGQWATCARCRYVYSPHAPHQNSSYRRPKGCDHQQYIEALKIREIQTATHARPSASARWGACGAHPSEPGDFSGHLSREQRKQAVNIPDWQMSEQTST